MVLMEPEQRVSWAPLLVFLLEVDIFLGICSVVGLQAKANQVSIGIILPIKAGFQRRSTHVPLLRQAYLHSSWVFHGLCHWLVELSPPHLVPWSVST